MIFVYVKREIIIDIFGKNESNAGNNLIIKSNERDKLLIIFMKG